MTDAEIIRLVTESADPVVIAVRDLHKPESPPPGMTWLDDGIRPHCEGCATGDPYLDPDYPCRTLEVVAEALAARTP